MSYDEYSGERYISQKQRKILAENYYTDLCKNGESPRRIQVKGTKFITNFWAKQWCLNLEKYEDMDFRLQQGRTLFRADAVIDMKIIDNIVRAQVVDSQLFQVELRFLPLAKERVECLQESCLRHTVASLLAFYQGNISLEIKELIVGKEAGLFPHREELKSICNCLDNASLCAHSASVLYAVACEFDANPEVFFTLRGVSITELFSLVDTKESGAAISDSEISQIFDISLE